MTIHHYRTGCVPYTVTALTSVAGDHCDQTTDSWSEKTCEEPLSWELRRCDSLSLRRVPVGDRLETPDDGRVAQRLDLVF